MAGKNGESIIIKKIKKGHGGGHHGGAWKIAYADFVTAMMAFFLLLWLISSLSDTELRALSEYFTPTTGLLGQMGIGFKGGTQTAKEGVKTTEKSSASIVLGAPSRGAVVPLDQTVNSRMKEADLKNFSSIEKDLYKAIHENPELKEFTENIIIEQTPEGLRIQILDNDKRSMFKKGSDELLPHTKRILTHIAKLIKYMPNYLSIDGHTNSVADVNGENWTLSALRAESTRKFLINGNLEAEQIYRIVGKGDQDPINKEQLESPMNMRVSIILLKNALVPYQKRAIPENISLEDAYSDKVNPKQKY